MTFKEAVTRSKRAVGIACHGASSGMAEKNDSEEVESSLLLLLLPLIFGIEETCVNLEK